MTEFRNATDNDQQFIVLKQYINEGWPNTFSECPPSIRDYWTFRDELSVEQGVVLKGSRVVIPKSLRSTMLSKIHYGHMGVDKCQKRARDTIFWPGISKDINSLVLNCSTCLEHRSANPKEPLLSHDIPELPWQVISTDLFTWNNQNFLVVVDYYCRYPEVEKLHDTSSVSVINKLKGIFSRQGVPQKVISDNGPQYSSAEFAKFALESDFKHVTSSPHFAQSNGLAERTVQTVKRLFDKSKTERKDLYICLLEYRATQLDIGSSPAQLLMGRTLRSLLPVTNRSLRPKTPLHKQIRSNIQLKRRKEKKYYDSKSKELSRINVGDSVRVKHPRSLWRPAVCIGEHSIRSYIIRTPDGGEYRRNRRHLLPTNEQVDVNPFCPTVVNQPLEPNKSKMHYRSYH